LPPSIKTEPSIDLSKLAAFNYENIRTVFCGYRHFLQAEAGTQFQTNVGLLPSTPFAVPYSRNVLAGRFYYLLIRRSTNTNEQQGRFKDIPICHHLGAPKILVMFHIFIVFIHVLWYIGNFW
jgi:hypothetical protein